MNKKKTRAGWILLYLVIAFAVFCVVYFSYLFLSYHRIEDNISLEIQTPLQNSTIENKDDQAEKQITYLVPGQEYSIISYNIGFGAYIQDFSFFMDGGKFSIAKSKSSVITTVESATKYLNEFDADFVMLQEVDLDSTRSYHVDERALVDKVFDDYYSVFAVNFDSAFLLYPLNKPHGKSLAGMNTLSKYPIDSSYRRSFPIATTHTKFLDLDRCFSVVRIPVEDGKYLCLYCQHMSAYGNNDEIRKGQIKLLCDDMEREYQAGNYVICGGDFNHDLKKTKISEEDDYSWAYPFPRESLPDDFFFGLDNLSEKEKDIMPDTTRNDDAPYVRGETQTFTVDGFILSNNIKMESYENVDSDFYYSDHNPVYMKFVLDKR